MSQSTALRKAMERIAPDETAADHKEFSPTQKKLARTSGGRPKRSKAEGGVGRVELELTYQRNDLHEAPEGEEHGVQHLGSWRSLARQLLDCGANQKSGSRRVGENRTGNSWKGDAFLWWGGWSEVPGNQHLYRFRTAGVLSGRLGHGVQMRPQHNHTWSEREL